MASASVTVLQLICFLRRRPRAGAGPLENPSRHLAAHVLAEVHLPNSFDRAAQPRIGNYAMFVVSAVGRRGRLAPHIAFDHEKFDEEIEKLIGSVYSRLLSFDWREP